MQAQYFVLTDVLASIYWATVTLRGFIKNENTKREREIGQFRIELPPALPRRPIFTSRSFNFSTDGAESRKWLGVRVFENIRRLS